MKLCTCVRLIKSNNTHFENYVDPDQPTSDETHDVLNSDDEPILLMKLLFELTENNMIVYKSSIPLTLCRSETHNRVRVFTACYDKIDLHIETPDYFGNYNMLLSIYAKDYPDFITR